MDVHETEFHSYDQAGEILIVIPGTGSKEVTRTKGSGVRDRLGQECAGSAGPSVGIPSAP